jgi:hypothetical protein
MMHREILSNIELKSHGRGWTVVWELLIRAQRHGDRMTDDARTLRPPQAAACTFRIAFGPRDGQKVLTSQGAMPREPGFKQALCANMQSLSLHAAVHCDAEDRRSLKQLCRTITRPALANERVQCSAARPSRAEADDTLARRHPRSR